MSGTIHSLKILFTWLIDLKWTDDQIGIAHYMDTHPNSMALDYNHQLFYNDGFATSQYTFDPLTPSLTLQNSNLITPFFIHFPGMNLLDSITFVHYFSPSKMFQPGTHYNELGTQINGQNHIAMNIPNTQLYQISLWTERGIYFGLAFVLICTCLFLSYRHRRKKSTNR